MPFTAEDSSTGETVDITLYENPRLSLVAADMVCPVCKSPMIIKAGAIVSAHFAHKPDPEHSCMYADYAAGETAEHRNGKQYVRKWVQSTCPNVDVRIEYPIYFEGHVIRIADVIQLYPNGWRVVYEVQLAGITTAKLEERTTDYLRTGCDVLWILGRDADTPANQQWCLKNQGCMWRLTWTNHFETEKVFQAEAQGGNGRAL